MAPRGQEPLLREIRAACVHAAEYVAELDETAFDALPDIDHTTFRAIKNALTEIGDAIDSLPDDLHVRHGGIDWKGLAGLRDMAAHQYLRLDTRRLWPVLAEELPMLLEAVEQELGTGPASRLQADWSSSAYEGAASGIAPCGTSAPAPASPRIHIASPTDSGSSSVRTRFPEAATVSGASSIFSVG